MKPRTLHRIAAALHAEPWLIRREMHLSLARQLDCHFRSRADLAEIIPAGGATTQAEHDCLADIDVDQGVAIVPVHGIVGKHLDMIETFCGGFDLALLQAQSLALMARGDVHSVIFAFNSPGGRAAAVEDTAQIMLDLGASKRTIAWCDDACSAAYWLAAACGEVYCGASSTVGSISAVCSVLDESEAYKAEGLKMEVFASGALKGAGIEGTKLTAAQRADIQARVDRLGARFKGFISSRRPGVQPDTMQGQFFYGEEALERGLVDALAPAIEHVIAAAMAS